MSGRLRWTFEADFPASKVPQSFVKVTRDLPNQTFTTVWTYLGDSKSDERLMKPLWDALIPAFQNVPKEGVPEDKTLLDYININMLGTISLVTWSSKGDILEETEAKGCWPTLINFGDLDFYGSEITIEVTWKFETATVKCHVGDSVSTFYYPQQKEDSEDE